MPGIPSIGALPAVPSAAAGAPTGLESILLGLGQLPQQMQQAQGDQLTQQNTIDAAARTRLKQLAALAQQNPAIASNPNFQRQVKTVYASMKQPVPVDNTGAINVASMVPGQSFEDMPAETKEKGLALPPGPGRDALWAGFEVPSEAKNAPMQTSLNPTMVDAAQKNAYTALQALGEGKITPQQYQSAIQGNASALGDAAQYYLSPDVMESQLGQAAQAQIDHLAEIGVHLTNVDAYQKGYLNYQMGTLAEKSQHDRAQEAQWKASDAIRLQVVQQGNVRLNQGSQRLAIALQNANTNSSRAATANLTATLGTVTKQYNDVQTQYDRVLGQIQSAANSGAQVDPDLLTQMSTLQSTLSTLQPMMDQANEVLGQMPGRAAAGMLGPTQRVNSDDGGTGTLHSKSKSGKPIYSTDNGATWQYGNG